MVADINESKWIEFANGVHAQRLKEVREMFDGASILLIRADSKFHMNFHFTDNSEENVRHLLQYFSQTFDCHAEVALSEDQTYWIGNVTTRSAPMKPSQCIAFLERTCGIARDFGCVVTGTHITTSTNSSQWINGKHYDKLGDC